MLNDLRYAVRMLRRTPGFTAVALIALTIGIGADTAIFTVMNAVLLQPLPFDHSEQLVVMRSRNPIARLREFPLSPPDFLDYRAQNHVFSRMSLVRAEPFLYADPGGAARLPGALVSPEFFDLFGIQPMLGRGFQSGEDNAKLVVLSYGLWQRQFGGERAILGRSIQLNDKPYTVIAVAPPAFDFPPHTELWTPFEFGPRQLGGRALRYAGAIARLKPGVRIEQASAEVGAIASRLAKQYPADAGWEILVRGLQENIVGSVRPAMLTLSAAVGFVLLIACANVANLLLARSVVRRREISVRAALGAGKARLIRQLLAESLVLALAGAGLGLWLAGVAVRILVRTGPNLLPRATEIAVNAQVLIFTVAIAVLTALLFGLAPALKLARRDINAGLRDSSRGAGVSFARNRSRAILIVGEVALSMILLAGACLLMRGFFLLRNVDPGFQPQNLLALRTVLPQARYSRPGQPYIFFEMAIARIRGLAGVAAAGASDTFPMTGGQNLMYLSIPGRPPKPPGQPDTAEVYAVTPGYFEAMRVRLQSGRFLAESDAAPAQHVCIVSASLASQFFAGENPVGRLIRIGGADAPPSTIVGVVGDVRQAGLDAAPAPAVYQLSARASEFIVVRSGQDPAALIPGIRAAVRRIDRDAAVEFAGPAREIVANSLSQPRVAMLLMIVFAGFALALALIGIYGVISYAVTQASREIGIRMALGAQRPDILKMVLRHGAILMLAGLAIGVPGALAATRLLQSQLYAIRPTDPLTYALTSLLLLAAGLLACLVPALRAMRVDPMEALRYE